MSLRRYIQIVENGQRMQIIENASEQTIFMTLGHDVIEINGKDATGWYADRAEITRWNKDVREYRRSERLKNVEPDRHEPVPMKFSPSKNKMFVYLFKPDGTPVTRDWLTMNGAFLSSEDE
jgi:hypothetical protein